MAGLFEWLGESAVYGLTFRLLHVLEQGVEGDPVRAPGAAFPLGDIGLAQPDVVPEGGLDHFGVEHRQVKIIFDLHGNRRGDSDSELPS